VGGLNARPNSAIRRDSQRTLKSQEQVYLAVGYTIVPAARKTESYPKILETA